MQRNGEGEKERNTKNHRKKWGGKENERMKRKLSKKMGRERKKENLKTI